MHQAYQDLIVNRATQMVGAATALKNINHSGLKGQLRELVVRDLLIPVLPPGYIVGQGEIVSAYGDIWRHIKSDRRGDRTPQYLTGHADRSGLRHILARSSTRDRRGQK